ncbi:hypothetical protein PG999_014315 [Apiospora kogelbergensis]|uniref:Uncharacterized protein n=1 Tax=Apiospora kogelbergensis TaxID=1337665 RepID=A0AAW0Q7V8_9PEZI
MARDASNNLSEVTLRLEDRKTMWKSGQVPGLVHDYQVGPQPGMVWTPHIGRTSRRCWISSNGRRGCSEASISPPRDRWELMVQQLGNLEVIKRVEKALVETELRLESLVGIKQRADQSGEPEQPSECADWEVLIASEGVKRLYDNPH